MFWVIALSAGVVGGSVSVLLSWGIAGMSAELDGE